jgi:hypothetical protein
MMLPWHNQDMDGLLRRNIVKRDGVFRLCNELGRNLSGDDLAKNAILSGQFASTDEFSFIKSTKDSV